MLQHVQLCNRKYLLLCSSSHLYQNMSTFMGNSLIKMCVCVKHKFTQDVIQQYFKTLNTEHT